MINTNDIFEQLKDSIEYKLKPDETKISTMTICLKMKKSIIFNCQQIGKYLKQDNDFITEIKFSNDDGNIQIRGGIPKRKKHKKKEKPNTKQKKDSFYNQVTIIVKVSDIKTINIKLFKNGSIQMTGCDSIENTKYSIEKLFKILNKSRYLVNPVKNKITEIKFVKHEINCSDIISGKVSLINCNFYIDFQINRDKLYQLISEKNLDNVLEIKKKNITDVIDKDTPQKYMDSTFDPIRHACVNIKLTHPIKTITIFVFESGSIIILGKSCRQIRDAYNFINVFLCSNFFNISYN